MSLLITIIVFLAGAFVGGIISKNIIVALISGIVAIAIYTGVMTVGFNLGKLIPRLW